MVRKPITIGEMSMLELDEKGQLFWKGSAVVLEQRFTLGSVERVLAGLAAGATMLSALWPIALYFHWFGLAVTTP